MAQNASTHGGQQHYAVPQPMPWPIMGSASLFMMALGAVFVFNDSAGGWIGIAAGFMLLLYMMVRWFGDVIRESEGGKYGGWEDVSFRWGMSFFIFSEVMFFAAFFGALFYARQYALPWLNGARAPWWRPDARAVLSGHPAWTAGLRGLGPTRAVTYAYGIPPLAVLIGAVVLDEEVTIWLVLGAALVVGGIALAQRAPAARRSDSVATWRSAPSHSET